MQGFRSDISHIMFLGEVELGVPKLDHASTTDNTVGF